MLYFNPRSLTGATNAFKIKFNIEQISIHAPLRERPATEEKSYSRFLDFNPRSLTGATAFYFVLPYLAKQISIHAPLRERPTLVSWLLYAADISIHAPLRERPYHSLEMSHHARFQSTLPYGSDLTEIVARALSGKISIHAPLRERHYTA